MEKLKDTPEQGEQALLEKLDSRIRQMCVKVRKIIEIGQQIERRRTGKRAIQRIIGDYFVTHRNATKVVDLEILLERLNREARMLGVDGEDLKRTLAIQLDCVAGLRAANQVEIGGDEWKRWRERLELIRQNPLVTREAVTAKTSDTSSAAKKRDKSELEDEQGKDVLPDGDV